MAQDCRLEANRALSDPVLFARHKPPLFKLFHSTNRTARVLLILQLASPPLGRVTTCIARLTKKSIFVETDGRAYKPYANANTYAFFVMGTAKPDWSATRACSSGDLLTGSGISTLRNPLFEERRTGCSVPSSGRPQPCRESTRTTLSSHCRHRKWSLNAALTVAPKVR